MASIFEGQPLKTRPFPIKTMVIWVLGKYIYLFRIHFLPRSVFVSSSLAPSQAHEAHADMSTTGAGLLARSQRGDQNRVFQNHLGVSKNRGTPKSSILIGFFLIKFINHPFWGTTIFGNTHLIPLDPKTHYYSTYHLTSWERGA